jgi:hypothetical protein
MILSPYAYLPVTTRKMEGKLLCFDPSEAPLYAHNVGILNKLKNFSGSQANRYYYFFELAHVNLQVDGAAVKEIDPAPLLIESCLSVETYYANETMFDKSFQGKTLLPAELLVGMGGGSNLAASRNILLSGLELKGVGRNTGAVRLDYVHAWGGMYFTEAVTEFITSNLCEYSTHLGAERTLAIGVHGSKDDKLTFKSNSFILRKRSAPRVSQAARQFEDDQSKSVFHSISKSDKESIENHLKKIAFHYFSSGLIGMNHKSLIVENALLNGKFIDTNSISMSGELNNIQGTILLSIDGKYADQINSAEDLVSNKNLTITVDNNSLKNYFDVLLKTLHAFELQNDDFELVIKKDKVLIAKIIQETLLEIGCSHKVINSVLGYARLPLKTNLKSSEIESVLSLLSAEEVRIGQFKTFIADEKTIVQINFGIDTGIKSRAIFQEFNKSQTSSFEKFIMSFSRMIELIDIKNNSLFSMLNKYVLENVKILPFTLNAENYVTENVQSSEQADSLLPKEAESFYCFMDEKIKRTRLEILNEKKPIIVYGYDYLNGDELHQQVMKPILFQ